jgi:hypothetical protein
MSHVRGHPHPVESLRMCLTRHIASAKCEAPACSLIGYDCHRQTDRQTDGRADVVLCGFMSYGTLHRCENLKFCTFRLVLHISFTLLSACCRDQSRLTIAHHSQELFVLLLTMGVSDHAALPHGKPSSGGRSRDSCGAQRRPKWSSCMYTYTADLFKAQLQ